MTPYITSNGRLLVYSLATGRQWATGAVGLATESRIKQHTHRAGIYSSATYRSPGERVRVGLIVGCALRCKACLVGARSLNDPVDPHNEALRWRASVLLCEKHAHD